MSLPTVTVWDLWSEVVKESEALGDPLLLECLDAAACSRIFDDLPDDKLKTSLSLINGLLNDPKTRPKGLTLLNELVIQVTPSRFIGFQDSITSALHLVVKGLELPLASTVLVNLLPKCHLMTEVNQSVTSSIIPKILAFFCEDGEDSSTQKSIQEIMLLKTCFEHYHGPCGQQREKLEKKLIPIIDSDNGDLIDILSETIPLLSFAGGGGNAGERHTKDWSVMLTKLLKTVYSTLHQLFKDHCPTLESENPFDGEQLSLKRVTESQVLLRMSRLKRRLISLLSVLAGYLTMPFPAPKYVPQKGILKLIGHLTSVNPATTFKSEAVSRRKETAFLTAITPGIHEVSLKLLKSLFLCVGSNIITDGVNVEQLISSEFKWLQEKPKAFENLKVQLYETLIVWLGITSGMVTTSKTLSLWVNSIGNDTRAEKDVVELKVSSKTKQGKPVKKGFTPSSFALASTTTQSYVQKSVDICIMALRVLKVLIPSMDLDNHRKVYEHLVKTVSIIAQFDSPPSPYSDAGCRKLVYESLSVLSYNPLPRSPVSLALLITLLRHGLHDSTSVVSSFCCSQIRLLERFIHPISASMNLAGATSIPVALDNSNLIDTFMSRSETETNVDDTEEAIIFNESLQSSEVVETPENQSPDEILADFNSNRTTSVLLENLDLQALITEAVTKTLKSILPRTQDAIDFQQTSKIIRETNNAQVQINNPMQTLGQDVIEIEEITYPHINGYSQGKKHENESIDNGCEANKRKVSPESDVVDMNIIQQKKQRINSSKLVLDGPTVEEMLSSFVDSEPVA